MRSEKVKWKKIGHVFSTEKAEKIRCFTSENNIPCRIILESRCHIGNPSMLINLDSIWRVYVPEPQVYRVMNFIISEYDW